MTDATKGGGIGVPPEELLARIRAAVIAERNRCVFGKHPPKGWHPRICPDRAKVMLHPDYTDELVARAALRFIAKYDGLHAPATYIHVCVMNALSSLRRDTFGERRADGKVYTHGRLKNKGPTYGVFEEDGTYRLHMTGGRTLHVRLEAAWGEFHRDGSGLYHQGAPEEPTEAAERGEEVAVLLRALNAREREIVRMRMWEGLSYAEIGRRIGLTRERIRQIWQVALTRLRMEMERRGKNMEPSRPVGKHG